MSARVAQAWKHIHADHFGRSSRADVEGPAYAKDDLEVAKLVEELRVCLEFVEELRENRMVLID